MLCFGAADWRVLRALRALRVHGISGERAREKQPRSICLKMVALQCVLSTVFDDVIVAFEQAWSEVTKAKVAVQTKNASHSLA